MVAALMVIEVFPRTLLVITALVKSGDLNVCGDLLLLADSSAMGSSPRAQASTLTRRSRQRQETVEEIKTLARAQLAEAGPGALSLRAIARQMGTASSALYRYFANYDELISALCVDAFDSVADALTVARDAQPLGDHTGQWRAICHAYRQWSLAHPADFALIFGTPVPGYHAPEHLTGPVAARFATVPLEVYAAAVENGAADPERTQVPQDIQVGELLSTLLDGVLPEYPSHLAGIALNATASVRGYLTMEIFGNLARLVSDTDHLFQAHLRTVMLGMGFDPAAVENADRPLG